jgi:hypothetical protein
MTQGTGSWASEREGSISKGFQVNLGGNPGDCDFFICVIIESYSELSAKFQILSL